ncbi:MAG: hypothetical protein WC455_11865 [Dehalococcoidia bacterium]|jgi:UDPglucose 6-dehydrogenase
MKIGIIGCGMVGNALYAYYEREHDVFAYDLIPERSRCGIGLLNANAEVVFICVPTPYAGNGKGLDCSAVYDAVSLLTGDKTVIIKSTVMPGTTDKLQELYPQHKFFFVPEFLSEATAVKDYANPRRSHIVGVPQKDWDEPEKYGAIYGSHRIVESLLTGELRRYYLPARQAELLKLATNSYYALKVTFANMLYDLGMTQETLDALVADPWIVPSHFQVHFRGTRGVRGACLPKDTQALMDYAGEEYLGSLLDIATEYNKRLIESKQED